MASPGVSKTWSFDQGVSLIFVAIQRPGEARARFRDQESEIRIGDDVDPRFGRAQPFAKNNHVFAAIFREAAKPLKNCKFRSGRGKSWRLGARGGRSSAGASVSAVCERTICSARVPRRLRSTARATDCKLRARLVGVADRRGARKYPAAQRSRNRREPSTCFRAPALRANREAPARRRRLFR